MGNAKSYYFRSGDVLHVIRDGETSNGKIATPGERIIQTSHFSRQQFEGVKMDRQSWVGLFTEFDTSANCLSCPFQAKNGELNPPDERCYTHDFLQGSGFISQIRACKRRFATWADIPTWREFVELGLEEMLLDACTYRYVRFGTYGEPVTLPFSLVHGMVSASRVHTGYTHAWEDCDPRFAALFMASTDDATRGQASALGWREYVARQDVDALGDAIQCPASKEAGYRSTCAKCGLCSGAAGKGNKSVSITIH